MKSNELGYFAILCTAVVVARVSHASRLVFMRTLVCAISGEFSCDRLNRRFSCENIFEKYVGHNTCMTSRSSFCFLTGRSDVLGSFVDILHASSIWGFPPRN